MVRRGAGLHADQTRRQLLEDGQYLPAPQLAANHDRTRRICTMDLKTGFARSDADRDNLTHWTASPMLWSLTATTSWDLDAGWGAVHSIKSCGWGPQALA